MKPLSAIVRYLKRCKLQMDIATTEYFIADEEKRNEQYHARIKMWKAYLQMLKNKRDRLRTGRTLSGRGLAGWTTKKELQ